MYYFSTAQPIEKRFFGFYQNGERLSNVELISAMEPDREAQKIMRSATNNLIAGQVIIFVGTSLYIADLVRMSNSDEFLPDFSTLSYVGTPLAITGSILWGIGNHKRLKAILLYNANINADSKKQKETAFEIDISGKGVGIRVHF